MTELEQILAWTYKVDKRLNEISDELTTLHALACTLIINKQASLQVYKILHQHNIITEDELDTVRKAFNG
jgi:hypothetical protein